MARGTGCVGFFLVFLGGLGVENTEIFRSKDNRVHHRGSHQDWRERGRWHRCVALNIILIRNSGQMEACSQVAPCLLWEVPMFIHTNAFSKQTRALLGTEECSQCFFVGNAWRSDPGQCAPLLGGNSVLEKRRA